MPARSQAQRAYLARKFGSGWMHAHHFDNRGKLPKRAGKDKRMAKRSVRDERIARFVKKNRGTSGNVGPTGDASRPYQQFVGVGGKQTTAPAGSGPLNPVRSKKKYYLGQGAAKYGKGSGRPD